MSEPIADPTGGHRRMLVLMRHASHRSGMLNDDGREQIDDVAEALAEWLIATNRTSCHVWHTNEFLRLLPETATRRKADECRATAQRLHGVLEQMLDSHGRRCRLPPPELVDLPLPPTYEVEGPQPAPLGRRLPIGVVDAACALDERLRSCSDDAVGVLVTNEPQVGWLLNTLAATAMSFSHGELIGCERRSDAKIETTRSSERLKGRSPYRTRFAITPRSKDDAEVTKALLAKVESKYRTAGTFSGVLVAVLTFVFTGLVKGEVPASGPVLVGAGLLIASAWLFFATLIFLDSLTMPSRFWAHRDPRRRAPPWLLERPPSSAQRLVHQNMVRIWSRMFVPAVACLGIAGISLLVTTNTWASSTRIVREQVAVAGLARITTTTTRVVADGVPFAAWLALPILIAVLGVWTYSSRPRVGSDD